MVKHVGGLSVNLDGAGGGDLIGTLKEACEECGLYDCECPDSPAEFNAMMDGVEAIVLALACAGQDVETEEFKIALQTAVNACAQHAD